MPVSLVGCQNHKLFMLGCHLSLGGERWWGVSIRSSFVHFLTVAFSFLLKAALASDWQRWQHHPYKQVKLLCLLLLNHCLSFVTNPTLQTGIHYAALLPCDCLDRIDSSGLFVPLHINPKWLHSHLDFTYFIVIVFTYNNDFVSHSGIMAYWQLYVRELKLGFLSTLSVAWLMSLCQVVWYAKDFKQTCSYLPIKWW